MLIHPHHQSQKKQVLNKPENLNSISLAKTGLSIQGTGLANTDYYLKSSDDKKTDIRTNDTGDFSIQTNEFKQLFGYIELSRDTNGFWLGGETVYKRLYYFNKGNKVDVSSQELPPVVSVSGNSTNLNVAGYFIAGHDLELWSNENKLSSIKVDQNGHFSFNNVRLVSNFAPFKIIDHISTGWFSSNDRQLQTGKYIDYAKGLVLAELPIYTREVSETQGIPFTTQTVESSSMNKGESKTTQSGVNGKKVMTYTVTYRGNFQIDKKLKSEIIAEKPVPKVITNGTYVYVDPVTTYTPVESAPVANSSVYYSNCTQAKNAGAAPLYRGQPGYRSALDRDKDGIACEK